MESHRGQLRSKYVSDGVAPPAPTIRYVGLFDTVGSFGVPGNQVNIGYRMDLPGSVQNAAQAVAQDEKRLLFQGTPLNAGQPGQNFVEKRFAGDHSDIGQGHGAKTNDLSRPPLEFIWKQGVDAGVPFKPLAPYKPTGDTTPHDLNRGFMSLWGLIPSRPR